MSFGQIGVEKDIVQESYASTNELVQALGFAQIKDELLLEAESFEGADLKGRASPGTYTNSTEIDHGRTTQAITYIDRERYDAQTPLPAYDVNSENAYQLTYNAYQQSEHNKPFCNLINLIINTRSPYFENSEDTKIVLDERASKEFIKQQKFKPDSLSVSHIYKKIGEKYYYISVESNIRMHKDVKENDLFNIVTIYEVRQKQQTNDSESKAYELHREGMYVQEAFCTLVELYIDAHLHPNAVVKSNHEDREKIKAEENYISEALSPLRAQLQELEDKALKECISALIEFLVKLNLNDLNGNDFKMLETIVTTVNKIIESKTSREIDRHHHGLSEIIKEEENEKFSSFFPLIDAIAKKRNLIIYKEFSTSRVKFEEVTDAELKAYISNLITALEGLDATNFEVKDFKTLEMMVASIVDIIESQTSHDIVHHYQIVKATIEEHEDKIFSSLEPCVEAIAKRNHVLHIAKTKDRLLAEQNDCPENLKAIFKNLPDATQAFEIQDLISIDNAYQNIIIFLQISADLTQERPLPLDLYQEYLNFISAIDTLENHFKFQVDKSLRGNAWSQFDEKYKSLKKELSENQNLKKIGFQLGELTPLKNVDEQKNIFCLLVFLSKVKAIAEKNKNECAKIDVNEFLQSADQVIAPANLPKLKKQVDAIKLELLPDLEKDKKEQGKLVELDEGIKLEMMYNVKNPIQRLKELGYEPLVDDANLSSAYFMGGKPEHVTKQRATTSWIGKKQADRPSIHHCVDNATTFDYVVNIKNKNKDINVDLTCKAEFDCIFDDDQKTKHFVIIEKNIIVEDKTADPLHPVKNYTPFHVVGVYQKDGTLIARYAPKDNANLAQEMSENLKTAVDQLQLDVGGYEFERAHIDSNANINFRAKYNKKREKLNKIWSDLFEAIKDTKRLTNDDFVFLIDIINTIVTQSISLNFISKTTEEFKRIIAGHSTIDATTLGSWNKAFENIIRALNKGNSDKVEVSRFNPQDNIAQQKLKTIIGNLDPEQLNDKDYALLRKIINTTPEDPKAYNQLIIAVIKSGIGEKTKTPYDKTAYNPLVSAMFVMSGLGVAGFIFVACAPLFAPALAILALEYCIGGIIAASITGLASHNCLKMWSPLFDVMQNVKTVAEKPAVEKSKVDQNMQKKCL
ncbi:MAG: hypothetical protein WC748_02145 [Legionellales bacterium]|jgi:hypothetical protein